MSRGMRKFGWAYTAKWIVFVGVFYIGSLVVWRDSFAHLENSDHGKKQIPIPVARPRRVDVPVVQQTNFTDNQPLQSVELAEPPDSVIAILVISATRENAIRNHLEQLIAQRPDPHKFPIYVSQDGDKSAVKLTIEEFVNKTKNVHYMQHQHVPMVTAAQRVAKNYFHIATHYKWALDRVFADHSTVIITEDDLDISKDFFSFFTHTRRILEQDKTVWCISAWNDNGASTITDQERTGLLYRTDFFPGLGWMLTAEVWRELSAQWPDFYWDDWMRRPEIRKNRVCIRPEVSRTAHNNRLAGKGSSGGMYRSFLDSVHLPTVPVDFSLVDMSRLHKPTYDQSFRQQLLDAKPITIAELLDNKMSDGDPPVPNLSSQFAYRVTYHDPREFRQVARQFKLMEDFRSGMCRTAYYGVITFLAHDHVRVFALHKNFNLTTEFEENVPDQIYDSKWDLMTKFLDFAAFYCRVGKWTGKCDPNSPEMISWFERRHQRKRLDAWGEMIVI